MLLDPCSLIPYALLNPNPNALLILLVFASILVDIVLADFVVYIPAYSYDISVKLIDRLEEQFRSYCISHVL